MNWIGHKSFELRSERTHADSIEWALDDACRDLTRKLTSRLEGQAPKGDSVSSADKPGKHSRVVNVRYERGLKPMPLIKLSGYFKDMGYQAKLIKSSAQRVRFRVSFEGSPDQFSSRLQNFLGAHYRIKSTGGKSKLNFEIVAP